MSTKREASRSLGETVATTNKVAVTGKRRPPAAGKGRPKGAVNKVTKQLKDMILGALGDAGGQKYLAACAKDPKTAGAFLTLLGKVLPSEIRASGPDGQPLPPAAPIFHITMTAE